MRKEWAQINSSEIQDFETHFPRSFLRGIGCSFYFESWITKMHTRPRLRRATLMSREVWVGKISLPDQEKIKKPRKPNVRSSSCVWCREKTSKPKHHILEQRNVYCKITQGDRWLMTYIAPSYLKGLANHFQKSIVGEVGHRVGCADQLMHYFPTGWWEGVRWWPRGYIYQFLGSRRPRAMCLSSS